MWSLCRRFSVAPGRYAIFDTFQTCLLAGAERLVDARTKSLKRMLKRADRYDDDKLEALQYESEYMQAAPVQLAALRLHVGKDLHDTSFLSRLTPEQIAAAHTHPLPTRIPEWAAYQRPLAGVFWAVRGADHWSHGQVRDIAAAFSDKHVAAGALEWLRAGCHVRDAGDWWNELRQFFRDSAKAGSGVGCG